MAEVVARKRRRRRRKKFKTEEGKNSGENKLCKITKKAGFEGTLLYYPGTAVA